MGNDLKVPASDPVKPCKMCITSELPIDNKLHIEKVSRVASDGFKKSRPVLDMVDQMLVLPVKTNQRQMLLCASPQNIKIQMPARKV